MSRQPVTKWAQRTDKVLITIELPDAKDVKLTLQPGGKLHFYAAAGADNVPYEIDFDLYHKINVDESKGVVGFRKVCYILKKAEEKWWSRLLRQGGPPPVFLKVDWDRWIDEDDQVEKEFEDLGFGDMEFSKLNMGGAEDDEKGEAKTATNPPAPKEFGATAEAEECMSKMEASAEAEECMSKMEKKWHDMGFDRLGVDWSKMNMDMQKYLKREHGSRQRAMFIDDDDDEDAANEDQGDEKEEVNTQPPDENDEDTQNGPSDVMKLHMGMFMAMGMMSMLMDDDAEEDSANEHEDDETEPDMWSEAHAD